MIKNYRLFCCIFVVLLSSILSVYSQIKPVVFSEIFYDSPLNEIKYSSIHHNGEFIELFNPTNESVDISGWKISDNTAVYIFPENTILASRSLIVVAYRYPNSGFHLSSLFPSINTIAFPNILYQNNIILMNDGEEIKLYDKSNQLIDKMSYRHRSTFGSRSGYWDICASNGLKPDASETSLISIQRNNIHHSTSGITSLVSDYKVGVCTPLKFDESIDIPYTDNLFDSDQVDTSLPVGSLPGNATISPSGAATYQIPIECPPGTNGLQPNLSVTYNSQGGQGIMGLGWDIAGLSAISRSAKNLYYDNENGKTINFDNTDCLTLDGQRLILLSGENLTEGAVYATEMENYSRVTIKKVVSRGYNFIYFVATTKDGVTIEYGQTPNSRVTNANNIAGTDPALGWKVNRITDVFGNTMEFSYQNEGQYISQILYLGSSRSYKNQIEFNYYENSSTSTKYKIFPKVSCVNGFWLKQDKILDNITIISEGSKTKTYSFNYIQSDRDLRLNTVATYNVANKKLTESKVKWGTENDKVNLVVLDKMADSNLNNVNNAMLYSGDIDGDGYVDKVEVWTGSEKTNEQGYIRVVLKNKSLDLIRFNSNTESADYFIPKLVIGDINNDGKDEIMLIERFKLTAYGTNKENTAIEPKGESFQNFNQTSNAWRYMSTFTYNSILMYLNNDQFPDLVIVPNHSEQQYSQWDFSGEVYYGGANYFSNQDLINIPFMSNSLALGDKYLGDFNADGRVDFMQLSTNSNRMEFVNGSFTIVESSSWGNLLYKDTWGPYVKKFAQCIPIDFNNDGLTDLLVQNNDEAKPKYGWYILKNNGGFNIEPTKIDLNFPDINNVNKDELYDAHPVDYNGDGSVDIILGDEVFSKGEYQFTNWYFYKNANGSFIADGTHRTYNRLSKMNPVIMDINNDGVQDLVFGSGNNYMAFTIANASTRYRVQSITNGLGQSDKFVYVNVANPNNTPSPESVMNIHAPFTIVTSYEDKNGTITNYEYGVPKTHTKGKGFLGFETITTKTPRMGIKTVTTYEINNDYYGLNLKRQEVFELGSNNAISSSTQTNSVVDGNSPDNAIKKGKTGINRFMPYISSSKSTDNMRGTSQTINNLEFDANWNVTKQESVMGEATKITETTYIGCNGNDILYLPETIKVTQKRMGKPDIVSQTNYSDYNAAGQVGKVTLHPDTDGEITTEYLYHPTGNLKEKKVTPKGLTAQTTTYGYDANYRLCTSEINSLNQTANTTYNYTTGDVLTKTDVNGFVTEYKYNADGRLDKEIQPNGEEITYKTEWTNSYGAVYKQTATNTKIINTNTSYFDKFGREIYSEQTGWKGKTLVSSKEYNAKGQLAKATLPHYAGETTLYTEYEYNDILGRITKEKTFDGKQVLTTDYGYTPTTTTITPPDVNQKKTELRDNHGLVVERSDAGGKISYTYNAAGQPLTIISNESKTEIEYDDYGNHKLLKDPNAGNISFTYYANGLLHTQTNAKGDITEMAYDAVWRIDTKTVTEKATAKRTVTKHTYVSSGNGIGQIETIELKEQDILVHKQTFGYNAHHQSETVTDEYDGLTVLFSNGYDALWRPSTNTSPSGLTTTNHYNDYGDLDKIFSGNVTLWEGNEQNSKGQFTNYTLGNGLTTTRSYSDRGEVESIRTYMPNSTVNIQNNSYSYYAKTANLHTRKDLKNGRNEEFEYDELDRLTKAWLNGVLKHDMSYHPNGNIDTKSDVGTYKYETPRPHAMSGIDNVGAGVGNEKQFICYTPFNKVSRIEQGLTESTITKVYDIFYGLDEQRIKTSYDDFAESEKNRVRYYFGTYEKDSDTDGNITNTDYIYSPVGLIAIRKNNVLYYVHTDLLGSIERITNASGAMVSEYAYTPWGGRILLSGVNITDRGYTGHEHLSPFGDDTNSGFCLINMNGRIYDPVLARFLSPDPYVQSPDFTQSFNRYSYCSNNPFKYTDPSGNSIIAAILIGATINLVSQIIAGNVSNFGDAYLAFNIGALGGLAGAGAGAAISSIIGGSIGAIGGAAVGAAGGTAGGFVGGAGNAWFNGSNFGDGLVAGLKGAGMGMVTGGTIGGFLGGINSIVHGGDFWTGDGATSDFPAAKLSQKKYNIDGNMKFTSEYATEFKNENFIGFDKRVDATLNKNLKNLYAGGKTPKGYKISGDIVYNRDMIEVGGTTVFRGIGNGSDVYLYKVAFQSKEILYQVMQHEFVHVHLNSINFQSNTRSQESAAYRLNIEQAKIWGMPDNIFRNGYNKYHFKGIYPNLWNAHPFKPINYLPFYP